jgi:hypothetical protein
MQKHELESIPIYFRLYGKFENYDASALRYIEKLRKRFTPEPGSSRREKGMARSQRSQRRDGGSLTSSFPNGTYDASATE